MLLQPRVDKYLQILFFSSVHLPFNLYIRSFIFELKNKYIPFKISNIPVQVQVASIPNNPSKLLGNIWA